VAPKGGRELGLRNPVLDISLRRLTEWLIVIMSDIVLSLKATQPHQTAQLALLLLNSFHRVTFFPKCKPKSFSLFCNVNITNVITTTSLWQGNNGQSLVGFSGGAANQYIIFSKFHVFLTDLFNLKSFQHAVMKSAITT